MTIVRQAIGNTLKTGIQAYSGGLKMLQLLSEVSE